MPVVRPILYAGGAARCCVGCCESQKNQPAGNDWSKVFQKKFTLPRKIKSQPSIRSDCQWAASAVGFIFFKQGFELPDDVRIFGVEVAPLREVLAKIVELPVQRV